MLAFSDILSLSLSLPMSLPLSLSLSLPLYLSLSCSLFPKPQVAILVFTDNYESQCVLTVCYFVGNALCSLIEVFVVALPSGRVVQKYLERVPSLPSGRVVQKYELAPSLEAPTGDQQSRIKVLRGRLVIFNREIRNNGEHV